MALNLNKGGKEKLTFDLSKSKENIPKINLTKSAEQDLSSKSTEGGSRNEVSNKSASKSIALIIGILFFVGLIGLGWWYFIGKDKSGSNLSTASNTNLGNAATTEIQSDVSKETNTTPTTASNERLQDNTSGNPSINSENTASTSGSEGISSPSVNESAAVASSTNSSNESTSNNSISSQAQTSANIPVVFKGGHSSFSSIDEKLVAGIIDYLSKNPNSKVIVSGYASSEGDISFNEWLSEKRANVFKEHLVSKGVSENKIEAIGKGIEDPIADNDTKEGRAKNRRIEITYN